MRIVERPVVFALEALSTTDRSFASPRIVCVPCVPPFRVEEANIADISLPPEMLPRIQSDMDVIVCSGGACEGDAPCPWCLRIAPGDDWEAKLSAAWALNS